MPMQIAVTGTGGFIGSALCRSLAAAGHTVFRLVRGVPSSPGGIPWDPARARDLPALDGVDAVVHLAGAGIADARWSPARKERILRSRVDGTRSLLTGIRNLSRPPRVFLCASATGIYGRHDDEWVDETHNPGSGFLADVCRAWESTAREHAPKGMRVIHLRFGMVLDPAGGALARLVPLFRFGLGGPIGGGRFFVPWIDRMDAMEAIRRLAESETAEGPYNLVAPHPVRQRDFAKALGRALHRPAVWPTPGILLHLLYGRMADEALLQGVRARPARLEEQAFSFRSPTIEACFLRFFPTPLPRYERVAT